MKNKITTIILGLSIAASTIPMQVFAQYEYTDPTVYDTSVYNYTSTYTSGYNYYAPTVSNYNYTSPTVSEYNYTSPTVSNYNYTSPTVSEYNYTSPTVSNYNYTSPTVSNYNYTSPTVSEYNYTSPTVSNYNYTSPTVSNYDYTSPTYNYTSPTVSDYTYTSPTYTAPTYTSPTYTSPTYTAPTYTTPTYTTPTYTTPTYTTIPTYTTTPTYTTIPTIYPTVTYPTYTPTPVGTSCPVGSSLVNGTCTVDTVVCPNGSTLISGVCQAPITCPTGTVLTNGTCIGNGTTVCPVGSTLTNGVCQINTTSCPTGSTLVNGICQVNVTSCPTGTVLTNGACRYPTGSCPTGSTLVNGVCQVTTTTCPSGSSYVNGSCVITTITPTYPVVNYQVCWDGSTVSGYQTCPTQFKLCNGSYVSINQSCYQAPVPVYVPPTIIKFNNVVTSIATQITNTSGRCNGIGLIANGAPSTGWFEYGETANLGRTTGSAAIGNANTAPFSNVLANLKPTTKYYCRAVMQNQYGIVKGEIVSFVTKSKAVTYVKPIIKTTTVKKPVVKKPEVICSDGSTISVKNATSAAMLNQGDKLVSLQVEKTDGKLSIGSSVTYKVVYKNLTDSRLTDVVVKVVLPVEITSVMATAGTLDDATHTLTLNQSTMDAYSEGVITIVGTVAKDAPVGKTVVATTYTSYTVPGTHTQDEVTAYVVGSILPADTTAKSDTGAKKVVGANSDRGFMPNTLVEWLALIAIIAIIFILGRSIYISYQDDGGDAHGH